MAQRPLQALGPGPEWNPQQQHPLLALPQHGPTSPGELPTGITGNQNSSARHWDCKIIITKVTEQQTRKPAWNEKLITPT